MSFVKSLGSTEELQRKLRGLSPGEGSGIPSVAVKCVDIGRNTSGEGGSLDRYYAQLRKPGERTGLDTPVVLAVNDEHLVRRVSTPAVPALTH